MELPFLFASAVLALTPGADMLYVVSRTVAGGVRAGVASALGIAVGAAGHTCVAAVGVSAIVLRSPGLYAGFVWAGAAFLVYLGVKTFRSVHEDSSPAARPLPTRRVFLEGVAVNALNPKVSMFFLGLLPQFVEPGRGSFALQMLVLGTVFNALGTSVNLAVAAGTGWVQPGFRSDGRTRRWHRRISGCLLVGLGIGLALSRR